MTTSSRGDKGKAPMVEQEDIGTEEGELLDVHPPLPKPIGRSESKRKRKKHAREKEGPLAGAVLPATVSRRVLLGWANHFFIGESGKLVEDGRTPRLGQNRNSSNFLQTGSLQTQRIPVEREYYRLPNKGNYYQQGQIQKQSFTVSETRAQGLSNSTSHKFHSAMDRK
ncbi:hypothetical protein R1sor_013939 [Riccia sorocarpa]|uniref:Uncharacterized protein n=1 Tax=Riccia sorocarpa TaxID=122646 RepID=A0ABD3H804_9MARC